MSIAISFVAAVCAFAISMFIIGGLFFANNSGSPMPVVVSVAVAALVGFTIFRSKSGKKSKPDKTASRHELAAFMTLLAVLVIALLGLILIANALNRSTLP